MDRVTQHAAGARDLPGEPLDVQQVAGNLPFVVRTMLGMAGLAVSTNVIGVLVVVAVNVALNQTATRHQVTVVVIAALVFTAVAVIIGIGGALLLQRRTLRWLLRGESPSRADAVHALRLPMRISALTIGLWVAGAITIGSTAAAVGKDLQTAFGIGAGIALAGLATAGLSYLLIGRAHQPVALLALAAQPPSTSPVVGVRWRLVVNWALTTATPIVSLVIVLTSPRGKTHVVGVSLVVAVLALLVSGVSISLSARAIGKPLRSMVDSLRKVRDGELETGVEVDDAGEIGLVQNGFNEMVAGLRERERIQDLFGRHVGSAVAAQAIDSGVTLRGESLDVVALFVDITGSTSLTRQTEPVEFVEMLNRFFEIVVDEVEGNGGLLNKFEGDAALCVFGAPAPMDNPATAALTAARAIRDRVGDAGEVEIGIGVASGPVIAGQIGTASRLEYTIIGDAVNEASRLTDLAKRVDGRILASAATVEAASDDERALWEHGRQLRLRGRETPTDTYRSIVDPAGASPSLAQRIGGAARVVTDFPPLNRN